MEGGIKPDGERELNYAVLTATHGSGAGNYDPIYAFLKRQGKDAEAVYKGDETNKYGLEKKYDKNVKND